MFREMRGNKQLLTAEDTIAVMNRCTNGVLACLGDKEYPYAVPLSFVFFNDAVVLGGGGYDLCNINPAVKISSSWVNTAVPLYFFTTESIDFVPKP